MDWSKGFTAGGKRRRELIRKLHEFHKKLDGHLAWVENSASDAVLSYTKKWMGKEVLVVVNSRNHSISDVLETDASEILMESGAVIENGKLQLAPYGYLIAKKG